MDRRSARRHYLIGPDSDLPGPELLVDATPSLLGEPSRCRVVAAADRIPVA
jgi:hypothetical protein